MLRISINSHELRSPEFPRTPSAARPEYFINPELTDAETREIALSICDQINNKSIEKTMFDVPVSLTWRIIDETDLLHYYTSDGGMMGDAVVKEHTKMVLSDIQTEYKDFPRWNTSYSVQRQPDSCI